jgi:hypothetical protein
VKTCVLFSCAWYVSFLTLEAYILSLAVLDWETNQVSAYHFGAWLAQVREQAQPGAACVQDGHYLEQRPES